MTLTDLIPGAESVKWIAGIGLMVALAGGGYWKGHHDEAAQFDLYKSEQAAVAEKQAATAQADVRRKEESAAINTAAIISKAQASSKAQLASANQSISALRDGTLRLRIANASAGLGAGVSGAGATASGISTGGAYIPVGLSVDVSQRLARADQLAQSYNAAIEVMKQDRLTCSGG
jgi:hypothetical protein